MQETQALIQICNRGGPYPQSCAFNLWYKQMSFHINVINWAQTNDDYVIKVQRCVQHLVDCEECLKYLWWIWYGEEMKSQKERAKQNKRGGCRSVAAIEPSRLFLIRGWHRTRALSHPITANSVKCDHTAQPQTTQQEIKTENNEDHDNTDYLFAGLMNAIRFLECF